MRQVLKQWQCRGPILGRMFDQSSGCSMLAGILESNRTYPPGIKRSLLEILPWKPPFSSKISQPADVWLLEYRPGRNSLGWFEGKTGCIRWNSTWNLGPKTTSGPGDVTERWCSSSTTHLITPKRTPWTNGTGRLKRRNPIHFHQDFRRRELEMEMELKSTQDSTDNLYH